MDDVRFSAQVKEVINRNALVNELLTLGFNAYLPVYDCGVDLVAYRDADASFRPIQLKGRWIIDRKYEGKGVWIAFPSSGGWFVAPHDEMVKMGQEVGFCSSSSWTDGGAYSCPSLSKRLALLMEPYRLNALSQFCMAV